MKIYDYLYEQRGNLYVIGLLLLALLLVQPVLAFSGSGAGTGGDPYQITSTSQWNEMTSNLSASYKLMDDLNFGSATPSAIGDTSTRFTGNFNGNGKTIMNLVLPTVSVSDERYVGLFNLGSGSTVKDLGIYNADWTISGDDLYYYMAGFITGNIPWASGTVNITSVFVDETSSIKGYGIHNRQEYGSFVGRYNTYTQPDKIISYCGSNAELYVEKSSNGAHAIGGIVGVDNYMDNTIIFTNYFGGTATTGTSNKDYIGGVSGGTTSNGQATWSGSAGNMYYDSTLTPSVGNTAGTTAKTTSQMRTENTYSGWSFGTTAWRMSDSNSVLKGSPVWHTFSGYYTNPPVAAFSANQTNVHPNDVILFTDSSTNTPTSWSWGFGDSGTSTSQNPTHSYSTTGLKTVTLTASNSGGNDDETKTNYINVTTLAVPTVAFSFSPSSIFVGTNTVTLTDTGTTGAPDSYFVKWGQSGSTSTDPNLTGLSFGYSTPTNSTTYTIDVSAHNAGGWSANVTHDITFYCPPFASWNDDQTDISSFVRRMTVGGTVTITDNSTNMPTAWNLSWGTTPASYSTTSPFTKTYAYAATAYVPSLTVSNPAGSSTKVGTSFKTYQVYQVPVFGTYTQTPTGQNFNVDDYISMTATASPAAKGYRWDFDGARTNGTALATGNLQYNIAGTFTPKLMFQKYGNNATYYVVYTANTLNIQGSVVPSLTANVTSGEQPLTVNFTDTSTGGIWQSTDWNFGDGTGSGLNVEHTYTDAGTYSVSMTHTNTANDVGIAYTTITVGALQAPTPGFTMNTSSTNVPCTVAFTDTSTNAVSWSWGFGDGQTSTAQNPTHSYDTAGVYTVTLTVYNGNGQSSITHDFTALIAKPLASFTTSAGTGTAPIAITFTDTGSGGGTLSYLWNFGDGVTSTAASPSHTYTTGGYMNVTQTVTNAGGSSVATTTITILPLPNVPISDPNGTVTLPPTTYNAAPSISLSADPTKMYTPMVPVQAWLGDNITCAVNTTGITEYGGYVVDYWKIGYWRDDLFFPGDYTRNIPVTTLVDANAESVKTIYADTIQVLPDGSTPVTFGNMTNVVRLFAVNTTAPDVGFGQGAIPVTGEGRETFNVEYSAPFIEWTWDSQSTGVWSKPGETLTMHYYPESFQGLTNQEVMTVYLQKSVDGGIHWTTPAGWDSGTIVTGAGTFDMIPTDACILKAWIVAGNAEIIYGNQIRSYSYETTVQQSTGAASFLWKNNGGTTITGAVDTDTIRWGLDTGTADENHNYQNLVVTFYKYNVATGVWDALTTPTPITYTWGHQRLQQSGILTLSTVFTVNDKTVKLRAVGRAGGSVIMQSADLTVTRNGINPTNIANGAGGFMGLGNGMGGILFGTIIALIIGSLAFLAIRDARVFIIGGLAGVAIAFALGMYPMWLIVIIGIAGIAAMLFASGLLGGKGEGGSPPVEA